MATKNDITGDSLTSKVSNEKYAEGWDRIFGKKKQEKPVHPAETRYPHLKDKEEEK